MAALRHNDAEMSAIMREGGLAGCTSRKFDCRFSEPGNEVLLTRHIVYGMSVDSSISQSVVAISRRREIGDLTPEPRATPAIISFLHCERFIPQYERRFPPHGQEQTHYSRGS